jgi:hypothetical protein
MWLPALIVYPIWIATMAHHGLWEDVFSNYWPGSLGMVLGSFIAGTSLPLKCDATSQWTPCPALVPVSHYIRLSAWSRAGYLVLLNGGWQSPALSHSLALSLCPLPLCLPPSRSVECKNLPDPVFYPPAQSLWKIKRLPGPGSPTNQPTASLYNPTISLHDLSAS